MNNFDSTSLSMSATEVRQLKVPISFFRNGYDSGQKRSFALADEQAAPKNALIIAPVDEGIAYCDNANFLANRVSTWSELTAALTVAAAQPLPDKESAQLLCPTTF